MGFMNGLEDVAQMQASSCWTHARHTCPAHVVGTAGQRACGPCHGAEDAVWQRQTERKLGAPKPAALVSSVKLARQ